MCRTLQIIVVIAVLISCKDQNIKSNPTSNQIDSLLSFEKISAVYSFGDRPPIIADENEIGKLPRVLHTDSINRWTKSEATIDKIKTLFPRLRKHYGSIETTCCGHRSLLFATEGSKHSVSWNTNTSDSAVFVDDTILYSTNKKILDLIFDLPDRKIIAMEIPSSDTGKYILHDPYNAEFGIHGSQDTRIIYLLR